MNGARLDGAKLHRRGVLDRQLRRGPASRYRTQRNLTAVMIEQRNREERTEGVLIDRRLVPEPRRIQPRREGRGEDDAVAAPQIPLVAPGKRLDRIGRPVA